MSGQLNIAGGVLLILTVSVPLCALTIGGGAFAWNHPLVITLFVVFPFLLVGLYYHESHIAANPTIPIALVSQLAVARVFLGVFGVVFAFNTIRSWHPLLYLQLTPLPQILFNLPLYIHTRAIDGTPFADYGLTCVFVGLPIGAVFGGFVIR